MKVLGKNPVPLCLKEGRRYPAWPVLNAWKCGYCMHRLKDDEDRCPNCGALVLRKEEE